MATMEKPKSQKKKKPKQPITKEEEPLTESPHKEDLATTSAEALKTLSLDIDFPTTKCDDIESHDCFISSNYQPFDKISLDDDDSLSDFEIEGRTPGELNKTLADELEELDHKDEEPIKEKQTDESENKIEEEAEQKSVTPKTPVGMAHPLSESNTPSVTEIHDTNERSSTPQPWTQSFEEPSAPVLDAPKQASQMNFQPKTNVQYPDLSKMSGIESKTEVFYQTYKPNSLATSISRLKPFTTEQMREIYYCPDLEMVKQFELEFLMNSLLENCDGDPIYELLQSYFNLQSKLTVNINDMKSHQEQFANLKDDIWMRVEKSVKNSALCRDMVMLSASKTFEVAVISTEHLALAMNELNQLHQLVCYRYAMNVVTTTLTKIKINKIVAEIMYYPAIRHITNQTPISLNKSLSPDGLHCISRLRRAISILFSFLRRPSPNTTFIDDIRQWLTDLISLHIRVATREDHWFLLFHVLRCPNGVGNWAPTFIQLPLTSITNNEYINLSSPEINHCVAILYILLLPIKKRNDFLRAFSESHKEISDPVKDDLWILIESDGEEGTTSNGECIGLRESDMIALLDQIPFERLFCYAMNIEKTNNTYILEADLITGNQMLRVIAFSSTLVEIFGEGMLTYNRERYKQLAKRLGRLVRHLLQYVSDYHELFIRNNLSKDPYLCERINVELNALLIKACSYIYRTRNLAMWQYFSSLPYSTLDSSSVWQLFFYLNVGFPTQFPVPHEDYIARYHATDFWNYFNGANADSSTEDLYYLLQAFFEMANERDKVKDWELIQVICLHIFDIGFINEKTRDICYKTSRDMLVNLTLAYHDLMSSLLLQLKIRFEEVENAAYLFKSLPLENWKPAMDSFEILSTWLLHYDYNTNENTIARIIISHLNWGFDCDGRLYLPHNIHVRMACLVSDALTKHAPEVVGSSGISESVRQVSNLMETQSSKDQFAMWCWNMVSILKLHLMDQSVDSIKATLQNPAEPLMFIPDLERLDSIYQGVTESRPLAMYVAIMVSLWGHSVPLICQRGFEQMRHLLNDYRHSVVIRCIELVVPLFFESPETLANCEVFQTVLQQLLNADRTYLKMAKDMIFANSIGPVLELLDGMIQHQMSNYYKYGLTSPMIIVNIWLHAMTNIPNWQNTSVVYLIDNILKIAYQFTDAWCEAKEYFLNYYKDCFDWKGNKMSTLKMFLGSNQTRLPNVTNSGWFALLLLDVEFDLQDSKFWSEFIRQVAVANINTKTTLESALKKTASLGKFSTFPPQNLVIYKYANLISTMDCSHPTLPLLLQQFFILFLVRVPVHPDEERFQCSYGVSDKFYEYNVTLMKKVKTNIKAAEAFYSGKASNEPDSSYFSNCCSKMMKTYSLWLEETTINKITKDQLNFPPQYNTEKLQEVLNGNRQHWTELIYLPKLRKEQQQMSDQWCKKCLRSKSTKQLRSPLQPKPRTTPLDRIRTQLKSYDKHLDPPALKPNMMSNKPVQGVNNQTLNELRSDMKVLDSSAKKFNLLTCEINSLNQSFKDAIPTLYENVRAVETSYVSCSSILMRRECSQPASIQLEYVIPTKVARTERTLDSNRERHDTLIKQILKQNVDDLAMAIDRIESVIRYMVSSQVESGFVRKYSKGVTKIGIQFFYDVVKDLNKVMQSHQSCNDVCTNFLNELGVFIQDNLESEGLRILELALKRPDLLKIISNLFVPYRTQPKYFIEMYKYLVDSHMKRCDPKILFVLLSKFDLPGWLANYRPKLSDINQLLKLIIFGLESWNQLEADILQDLFRRHLLYIFDYEFPEHYGEVIQLVLDSVSKQKLMPVVLLDLLNSLTKQFNCEELTMETNEQKVQEISADFARRQNLFTHKAATDTVILFAKHFQRDRLHHGLHGLYPKHAEYCRPLAMWFSCLGHVVVTTAIAEYPGLLADQISDGIFGTLVEIYVPWLVAYTEQEIQSLSPTWIRQLVGQNKLLYPWSQVHMETSRTIITPFINSILFVLENLPVSQTILGHTFSFYIHHYAVPNMEQHVRKPIHDGLVKLPWELFKPSPNHISLLYDSLKQFIPESHALLGHIFIRIEWNSWMQGVFSKWPPTAQSQIISHLLTIFVKISFEPSIHVHTKTSKILEDAIVYPWHMVEYQELEELFKWFVVSVEQSIIFRLPSVSNYVDRAVLDLILVSSGMAPEKTSNCLVSSPVAKRIIWAKSTIRMLRMCAAKYQKLLATKDAYRAFTKTFHDMLNLIDRTGPIMCTTKRDCDQEAFNVMMEVVVPMQTQSEEISKLFIDALISWQTGSRYGNALLCQTLHTFGHSKGFIAGIYTLIESTILNYFRVPGKPNDEEQHRPSWIALLKALETSYDKLDVMQLLRTRYFVSLHAYIIYKVEHLPSPGEKITFLQDLSQLLEHVKTSADTEPRVAIVWGAIISSGCKILSESENAKKPLLMLARHFHVLSTQTDGWGDGLLGVIGIKKDSVSNRRKVLTRCISCIIFSLFPDTSSDSILPNQEFVRSFNEMKLLLANKKFNDVKMLIVQAIELINDNKFTQIENVPGLVYNVIRLFYDDNILQTVPEVWSFEFKWP